ncbi:hypothetical protein ACSLBF_21010 (plasmid) [Pseudoalteromonas sp. T1lg65]|uniref:hypothetical protein n=1 Tax=Pseudoalteromonas sp. T1lg65 TaxID=2077101 RepID=UPI003F7A821C
MKLLSKLKDQCAQSFWHTSAMILVLFLAGTEIMVGVELMAMIELVGASTFVLAYLAGAKLALTNVYQQLKKFEQHCVFFLPKFNVLMWMPSLAIHAIPERSVMMAVLAFITLSAIYATISISLNL